VNVHAKLSGALVKQPGKALKVTPTEVSSAKYWDKWDGDLLTQVLSLTDVRANGGYSLTFPLHIAEGAHDTPHFSIVLTDPEDVGAAGKQTFQALTSYIAVLNIN